MGRGAGMSIIHDATIGELKGDLVYYKTLNIVYGKAMIAAAEILEEYLGEWSSVQIPYLPDNLVPIATALNLIEEVLPPELPEVESTDGL
jgi:hypothetical protein